MGIHWLVFTVYGSMVLGFFIVTLAMIEKYRSRKKLVPLEFIFASKAPFSLAVLIYHLSSDAGEARTAIVQTLEKNSSGFISEVGYLSEDGLSMYEYYVNKDYIDFHADVYGQTLLRSSNSER